MLDASKELSEKRQPPGKREPSGPVRQQDLLDLLPIDENRITETRKQIQANFFGNPPEYFKTETSIDDLLEQLFGADIDRSAHLHSQKPAALRSIKGLLYLVSPTWFPFLTAEYFSDDVSRLPEHVIVPNPMIKTPQDLFFLKDLLIYV